MRSVFHTSFTFAFILPPPTPDPARVLNMPPVIYVAIGLPGFIRCPVDANPPVTMVKWKKDGLPLRIEKVKYFCWIGFLEGVPQCRGSHLRTSLRNLARSYWDV